MAEGKPPNITARLLEEAKLILLEAGWNIASVQLTQASRRHSVTGQALRVVRQRVVGEGLVALVVVQECRGKV